MSVGSTEFRNHLRKYLKSAEGGRTVIIQERGRPAYVLRRYEVPDEASGFGCMRDRTVLEGDDVVNALETWTAGDLP